MQNNNNYPETRKPRDTSYSITNQLETKFGLDYLYHVWAEHGMYKSSKILSAKLGKYASANIVRYLSMKHNWKRVVTDMNLPFVQGIIRGTVPASYYKHVIIPGVTDNIKGGNNEQIKDE